MMPVGRAAVRSESFPVPSRTPEAPQQPGVEIERITQAARLMSNESEIVGRIGQALSQAVPRFLVKSYTLEGFPARRLRVSRHFVGGAEVPDSPACRGLFREIFLPVIRRAARGSHCWTEVVGDGLMTRQELRQLLDRRTALRALDVQEWGLLVATLGSEPVGGANVLVPLDEDGFSEDERERARALAPSLAAALRVAALVANAAPALHALEQLLSSRGDTALLFSKAGQVVGVSAAGERLLARSPEIQEKVGRWIRAAPSGAGEVAVPELGLHVHVSPCSPRGGAPVFLAVVGAQASVGARGRVTLRQVELLEILAEGLSNKEIASRMHLAPSTVKSMLEELYRVAGVSGRVALLRWSRGQASAGPRALVAAARTR
jgi:DNA-binding NarL/FixJ family response regulator